MRLYKFVWFVDRFMIYVVLFVLLIAIIFSLAYEHWLLSIIAGLLFLIALYKGLIRLKILKNSVVVRDSTVVFFVPETTVRNRFDFISRGQSIVELPTYQVLDRPFKVEIFFPVCEGAICSCRLSLRFAYLMQPTAWQRAYDSFVAYGERLPMEIKRLLLKSCDHLHLHPVAKVGEDAMREYLTPIVAHLNRGLENVGLEVAELHCSFVEGSILARFLAGDQQELEAGLTGAGFRWQVSAREGAQRVRGALLEVNGNVVR